MRLSLGAIRHLNIVGAVGLAFLMMSVALASLAGHSIDRIARAQPADRQANCSRGPINSPSSATHDLDEDAADWGVYCEGSPTWVLTNVTTPSLDGKSLQCSITGGAPYSNIHCYRNLLPEPASSAFTLTMPFSFTETSCNNVPTTSTIQALEFSLSKWHQSKRYELALQWQNVGDGGPRWRYWDPGRSESWVPILPTITHCLPGGMWHTLTLEGRIVEGQVHYDQFSIDGQTHTLSITVPPVFTSTSDGLALAIQLDGNATQSPYDMYIDKVSLVREPAATAYLPVVIK